jgi:two-component system sensor histidine kinase KdpD
VSSLRSSEVEFDPDDRNELLATAEESLDRLTRLVANLLDMSRLQAGALGVQPTPIGLEDAVPRALDELGPQAAAVTTDIPADLPAVTADPGLLERVLVNIVGNALRHSPPEKPPAVTASAHADHVELRVIDTGAGIPADQWEHVFLPFQRLGDRDNTTGVGLGLALSRGLAEAMGGGITPETTPGGGLTMVLRLPAATDTTTSERPHR